MATLPKHLADAIKYVDEKRYSKEYSIVATFAAMTPKEKTAFKRKDKSKHDGMYTCDDSLKKDHGVTRCEIVPSAHHCSIVPSSPPLWAA